MVGFDLLTRPHLTWPLSWLRAPGPTTLCRSAGIVYLAHLSRVLIRWFGVRIDRRTLAVALGRGPNRTGGSPADTANVRAATRATGALLKLIETGLQRRGGSIPAAWVRGGTHPVIVTRGGSRNGTSSVDITTNVRWERGVGQILLHVVNVGEIFVGRHGHGTLSGRGCRDGRLLVGRLFAIPALVPNSSGGQGGVGALRQSLVASPLRVFHCPGVVVLMPGQGCTARKGLLAVNIRALVWPLPRVNSTMTRERAAVTEGLSATLALVGFLAGMHTLVDGQGRSLDELFPTSRVIANVGTDSAVDALMARKIAPPGKALPTRLAGVRLWGRLLRSGSRFGLEPGVHDRNHGLWHGLLHGLLHGNAHGRRGHVRGRQWRAPDRGWGGICVSRILGTMRRVWSVHGNLLWNGLTLLVLLLLLNLLKRLLGLLKLLSLLDLLGLLLDLLLDLLDLLNLLLKLLLDLLVDRHGSGLLESLGGGGTFIVQHTANSHRTRG